MSTVEKEKSKLTSAEAVVLLAVRLAEISLDGWILSVLWRWFAVPFGAPAVGVMAACGIELTVRFVTSKRHASNYTFDEGLKGLIESASFALVSLGVGYLIHLVGSR